jgi:putative phage-type endonuclease
MADNNLIKSLDKCPRCLIDFSLQSKGHKLTQIEVFAPEDFNGARLLGNYAAGSPEWHLERSKGIGGSEVGTILGLNPYESAYALWAKKTNKIPSEIEENWAIRFGKAFEEPILKLWQEEHPEWELFTTGTYEDEHCSYRRANPDALARHRETGEWMIIEVKTARNTWDDVPPAYTAQVLHYMGVMKVRRGIIVAVAGMTWNEYEVPFNQYMINVQNEALEQFWNSVQTDSKPAWDGSESTYNAVRFQYDEIDPVEFELGQLGLDLLNTQLEADNIYKKLLKLKSECMDFMGTAKWGVVTEGGVTRRVASRQMRAGQASLIVNKKG